MQSTNRTGVQPTKRRDNAESDHKSSSTDRRSDADSKSTVKPTAHRADDRRNDYKSYVTDARTGGGHTRRESHAVATKPRVKETHYLDLPSRSQTVKHSSSSSTSSSTKREDPKRDPYDCVKATSKASASPNSASTLKPHPSNSNALAPPSSHKSHRDRGDSRYASYASMISSRPAPQTRTRRDHSKNTFRTAMSRAPRTKPTGCGYSHIYGGGGGGETAKARGVVGPKRRESAAAHGAGRSHHASGARGYGSYAASGAVVPYSAGGQSGAGAYGYGYSYSPSSGSTQRPSGRPSHSYSHSNNTPDLENYPGAATRGFAAVQASTYDEFWRWYGNRAIHGRHVMPLPPSPYELSDFERVLDAFSDQGRTIRAVEDHKAVNQLVFAAAEERLGFCPSPDCYREREGGGVVGWDE
jgi:hypothetical protein